MKINNTFRLAFCFCLTLHSSIGFAQKLSEQDTTQNKINVAIEGYTYADPLILAQKQLDAYNNHDLEAFLSCYSDSVQIFAFPNDLVYTGKEEMRKRYDKFFKSYPKVNCKLEKRVIIGNRVIDEENITGVKEGNSFKAVAIYETNATHIHKVFFLHE